MRRPRAVPIALLSTLLVTLPCLAAQAQLVLDPGASFTILTADTFGKARSRLEGIACDVSILPIEAQDAGKLDYVKKLGESQTACIGNGRNDRLMLKAAILGIAVILEEGAAVETVLSADVVCTRILTALELLKNPLRLIATLRS